MSITQIRHPENAAKTDDWEKFELAYAGGHDFVEKYVEKFSTREDETDFKSRKKYSYTPAFAKEAINEIKNSIFQRISDVTREGGTAKYNEAINGKRGGVDLQGSTMNAFIGREIIPQLLIKGKVGVYVDMPMLEGDTRVTQGRPYLYKYKAEDILSWNIVYNDEGYYFDRLLLREEVDDPDEKYGLPDNSVERFRYLYVDEDVVKCEFYNSAGDQVDLNNQETGIPYVINIPIIPFAVAGLTNSLMEDVADYQIAHVNLSSSDISYALRSNFPFYVEQVDFRTTHNNYFRSNEGKDNEEDESKEAGTRKIKTGAADGRTYAKGLEQPAFIHPSSDPLMASMEKQDKLKQEVRQLVHLALTNVAPKMASAESKEQDQQGLEAGLSYIGLELETFERMIARIWLLYENSGDEVTITYPRRYSIKSDEEKRKEAKELKELSHTVPSQKFKKSVTKQIASIILGEKIKYEELISIYKEIDNAKVLDTDPETIRQDLEAGIVDLETASKARGYPEGTVKQAKQDHAERLARIQAAQESKEARGVNDLDDQPDANGRKEKELSRNTDKNDTTKDKTRGSAK